MYKKYFDKGAKLLEPLSINDRVRIYDTSSKTWCDIGHVVQYDGPRSYLVETDNSSIFKRNQVHLKPVIQFTPSFDNPDIPIRLSDNVWNKNCSFSVPPSGISAHYIVVTDINI